MDPVSLKSLTTRGVFCSRYSKDSEQSQPAKMFPQTGKDHIWFLFFLGRQKWAMDGSPLHQRASVLTFIIIFLNFKSKWNWFPMGHRFPKGTRHTWRSSCCCPQRKAEESLALWGPPLLLMGIMDQEGRSMPPLPHWVLPRLHFLPIAVSGSPPTTAPFLSLSASDLSGNF